MTDDERASEIHPSDPAKRRVSERPSLFPFGQPLAVAPLRRWPDSEAVVPVLRARLRRAEKQRDIQEEGQVSAALARALVRNNSELDIAVRLGRRSVLLGNETLRFELAEWHCQLGQLDLAVGMLAPLVEVPGQQRAALLVRMALYWARLDRAEDAVAALREAVAYQPGDPLICELLGMVYGWAPQNTSRTQSSRAYLAAALGRRSEGEVELAQQDLLRAFDTSPESAEASEQLASEFRQLGELDKAYEVEHRHAVAQRRTGQLGAARLAQSARLMRCLREERFEEALSAALEGQLDASIPAEGLVEVVQRLVGDEGLAPSASPGCEFDWLLAKLGLVDLLAARLELAAEASEPQLRGGCYRALGALLEASDGSSDRAFDAYLEGVLADPGAEGAFAPLRLHARQTGDPGPLLEALLAVEQRVPTTDASIRRRCLVELLRLAEGKLAAPSLAMFCVERLEALEPTRALAAARVALKDSVSKSSAELQGWLNKWRGASTNPSEQKACVLALRRVVTLLRLQPDREGEYETALRALVSLKPEEIRGHRWLERLLHRRADTHGLSLLWTQQLAQAGVSGRALSALLGLSRLERRSGNLQGALAVLAADDHRGLVPVSALQVSLAAQLGSKRLWAQGLLTCGGRTNRKLRGWLATAASSQLLEVGERTEALRAAEFGTRAAPELAAPLVAYANAVEGRRDRVAAVALERAMALTFPSSKHCEQLVETLTALGDVHAVQVWIARWLGVQPSATSAAVQLLHHAAESGDAARLGDVVEWVVRQAHPLEAWAVPLAEALILLAESDRARACVLSRPLLNAFGPNPIQLRHALLHVAEVGHDTRLAIEVLERQVATETEAAKGELLWEVSRLQLDCGNVEGCLAALVRALAVGVQPDRILERLQSVPLSDTADAEFLRLQLEAGGLEQLGEGGERCWAALRNFGAAQWDLAQDPSQAIETWLRAAELLGAPSWVQFVLDWVEVQGFKETIEGVYRLAESRDVPEHGAALLSAAAFVALRENERHEALQLAQLALDTEPDCSSALGLIEASALQEEAGLVENAYRSALGATKGRFGERAIHYRAARYFEGSDPERALQHAVCAFRAVPSKGGTFSLVLRLSQSEARAERGCRVLLEVARSELGAGQCDWLERAALVAVHCQDGAMRRTELLLQALLVHPKPEGVELLGFALDEWARKEPNGRALGLLKLKQATRALLPQLRSCDGARVAIAISNVALTGFEDAELALEALTGAVALDPKIPEFSELLGDVKLLAASGEPAVRWLEAYEVQSGEGQQSSLELLELATRLAETVSPGKHWPLLISRVALRTPGNARVLELALQAVTDCRLSKLPSYVHELFPEVARQSEMFGRSEEAAERGDTGEELTALSEALELQSQFTPSCLARLIQLAGEAGQIDLAERALVSALGSEFSSSWRSRITSDLATRLLEGRRPQRALKVLLDACSHMPGDQGLLTQALSAARAAGEDEQRQLILQRLIDGTGAVVKKSFWLNEAWEVAKKRGKKEVASQILRQWLMVDPEDTRALERLEAECESRGLWSELAELLSRHLEISTTARERRRLVLRRSELLATHLDRLPEARDILAELIEGAPADRIVVERLAEVSERLGENQRAAEAWFTASGLSSTRVHAAELAERSCALYLDANEPISARRVLAAPQSLPRTLALAQLAVRLERNGDNQPGLAVRLEELASVQRQPTPLRAEALVEAANLWRKLGDDERASQCASKAAGWLPEDAEAQLLASYLEYRLGVDPTLENAERTAARLLRVEDQVASGQRELAAFLLVEAVEVREGAEAALAELSRFEKSAIRGPLLSLATAERLVRSGQLLTALDFFDLALAGDLRGLRKTSAVAVQAARAAFEHGLLGRAHRYLRHVDGDSALETEVRQLRVELEISASEPASVRPGSVRFRSDSPPAKRRIQKVASSRQEAPVAPSPGVTEPIGKGPVSKFKPLTSFEEELLVSLQNGGSEAGRELVDRLRQEPDRVPEALDVLAQWWELCPGDLEVLTRWIELSAGEHRAALRHILECWGGAASSGETIPSLSLQIKNARSVQGLLFRTEEATLSVALELVWQGVCRTLEWPSRAELKALPTTGENSMRLEARVFFCAASCLGLSETPLIQIETEEDIRVESAMAAQPAVVVRGRLSRGSSRFDFGIGQALAHAHPSLRLVGCCADEQLHEVLQSVQTAFGPPKDSRTTRLSTTRLAGVLWETVSASGQRVLKQVCQERLMSDLSIRRFAYRVATRAGLFVSGDLGVALHHVCEEEGLDKTEFEGATGLVRLCAASTMARDLVLLASSESYAALRWHQEKQRRGAGNTRRGM